MPTKKERFQAYLDSADVRPDRLDLRDRIYHPPLISLPARVPSEEFKESVQAYIDADLVRNQGGDGACTGFALKAVIDFLFWSSAFYRKFGESKSRPDAPEPEPAVGVGDSPEKAEEAVFLQSPMSEFEPVSARMLFHLALFYDDLAGEEGKGSSLRGAMKAWHRHGACADKLWEWSEGFKEPHPGWAKDAAKRPIGVYYRVNKDSIVDMQAAINEVGAIAVSAWIHKKWIDRLGPAFDRATVFEDLTHENLARIEWTPGTQRDGMHAFSLVGYNESGFIVQNSWGKEFGSGGFVILGYDDWVENGVDAWAAVLGVPIEQPAETQRAFIDSSDARSRYRGAEKDGQLRFDSDFWKRSKGSEPQNAGQSDNQPRSPWSVQKCYEHTVIIGSNGRAVNRLLEKQNASSATNFIAFQSPSEKFSQWHRNKAKAKPKIVIHALSGLRPDREELQRIQVLGKSYEDNEVYPIFVGWRNGFLDPFLDLAGKQIMAMLPDSDSLMTMLLGDRDERTLYTWDRTLEAMFESEGGKPMWTQFKQDAMLSAQQQRMHRRVAGDEIKDADEMAALQLLATGMKNLKREWPQMEIHLVAHSGGAIALSHFLAALAREMARMEDTQPVKSCTFYAPATSLYIANWRLRYYMTEKQSGNWRRKHALMDPTKFDVHVLSDELEQKDSIGPYHKSFLYLMSNALEEWSPIPPSRLEDVPSGDLVPTGTPVLGMKRATLRTYWHPATWKWVDDWYDLCTELKIPAPKVWNKPMVRIAPNTTIPASHESFPDNIEIVNQTLQKITGTQELKAPVKNLNWRALTT